MVESIYQMAIHHSLVQFLCCCASSFVDELEQKAKQMYVWCWQKAVDVQDSLIDMCELTFR